MIESYVEYIWDHGYMYNMWMLHNDFVAQDLECGRLAEFFGSYVFY